MAVGFRPIAVEALDRMPQRTSLSPDRMGDAPTLREGVYQFDYWLAGAVGEVRHRGLAVLRAGSVLGSDEYGGMFSGSYGSAGPDGRHRISVRFRLPAGGELVTGHRAGPEGYVLQISCEIEAPEPRSAGVVDVDGMPVALDLLYIGAVPAR